MDSKKIVCIGDSAVGKTTLLKGFFTNMDLEMYRPTMSVELSTLEIPTLGISFNVWDFSGQQYLREFQVKHFADAAGAIIIFDLSRRDTFYSVREWLKQLWGIAGIIPTILIGNKGDMRSTALSEIMVSEEEGKKFATYLSKQTGKEVPYIEISALHRINVNAIFNELGRILSAPAVITAAETMSVLDKSVKTVIDDEKAAGVRLDSEIVELSKKIYDSLETEGKEKDNRLIDVISLGIKSNIDEELLFTIASIMINNKDALDRFSSFNGALQEDIFTVVKKDPTWQKERMFNYFLSWKSVEKKIMDTNLVTPVEVSSMATIIVNYLMVYPEALITLEGLNDKQMSEVVMLLKEDPGAVSRLYLELYNISQK